jgi:hypothetical protein
MNQLTDAEVLAQKGYDSASLFPKNDLFSAVWKELDGNHPRLQLKRDKSEQQESSVI